MKVERIITLWYVYFNCIELVSRVVSANELNGVRERNTTDNLMTSCLKTKRYATRMALLSLTAVLTSFFVSPPIFADIYMYRDKNGTLHFTNVPTSPKFEVYIKERVKRRYRSFDSSRYDHLINRASAKHRVSFPLLKAIIKAESGFNPKAVSKKGAIGLMQIMPENVRLLKISDPFDPWENILGGTRYFKEMLNRFNGQLPLALAAYNAGPRAVDRYKNIPPFPETRQYVRRVLAYYRTYRRG